MSAAVHRTIGPLVYTSVVVVYVAFKSIPVLAVCSLFIPKFSISKSAKKR